jgi:hypothetical protein
VLLSLKAAVGPRRTLKVLSTSLLLLIWGLTRQTIQELKGDITGACPG